MYIQEAIKSGKPFRLAFSDYFGKYMTEKEYVTKVTVLGRMCGRLNTDMELIIHASISNNWEIKQD